MSSRGHVAMCGDSFLVTVGGRCMLQRLLLCRDQSAANLPVTHRTIPIIRKSPTPMVPRLRNPVREITSFSFPRPFLLLVLFSSLLQMVSFAASCRS